MQSLSIFVVIETLPAAPSTVCRISLPNLITSFFRNERKLALTCLKTETTLQYRHQKQAIILIVTILFELNACNNKISNKKGRVGSHLVWVDDFHCFHFFLKLFFFGYFVYIFWFFLEYFTIFFVFLCFFNCFWSYTAQGTTGRPISLPSSTIISFVSLVNCTTVLYQRKPLF